MKDCICPACMYGPGMTYLVISGEDAVRSCIFTTYDRDKAEEVAAQIEGATIKECEVLECNTKS